MQNPLRLLPLLICGAALASDPAATPTFGRHYLRSLGYSAVGAAAGGTVLAVATDDGEGRVSGLLMGVGLGSVVGAAWGAATITPEQEARGVFGLDLVAGFASGYALALTGYGVGVALQSEGDLLPAVLSGSGLVLGMPLGAVLAQRWIAGRPEVAVWKPNGSDAMGLRASWSLR